MADIINLDEHRPEPKFWQCGCGCAKFYLSVDDGYALCTQCLSILREEDEQVTGKELVKSNG